MNIQNRNNKKLTLLMRRPKHFSTIFGNIILKIMCNHQNKYAQLICHIENV